MRVKNPMEDDMKMTDARPGVAIIANSNTPYREYVNLRLARELKEIRLYCVYTHEESNASWSIAPSPETQPVSFGKGQSSATQSQLKYAVREWKKGGEIIRWMKQENIRAVVMLGYNDPGRLRMIRWCKKNAIPCFLFGDSNIKGDVTSGLKAAVKMAVVSRVVKACSGVMPCGSLGRDYFVKYGANPSKVYYFPYEPDYGMIRGVSDEEILGALGKYGLDPGRRRIVYSGRMIPIKHPEMAIRAFLAIAGEREEWDLVMIGGGPMLEEMKALAGGDKRVVFTGFVDNQRLISAIYRASDVLVHPSEFEPWGLVINEAAAAGMAMVTTDVVGAAAELVKDGVNGRLFKPLDQKGLEKALWDVTAKERIDLMKGANEPIIREWRSAGDPVAGLRRALVDCGLLE